MADMLSDNAAARLTTLVAEIEAEAYARGKAEARTDVLALLGAAAEPARRSRPKKRPARKRRAGGGGRAPKGAVRALVERALRDRPGLNAREILDSADTDAERLVKPSSIAVELTKGRRQGRYETTDGRWSLAASSPVDAVSQDAPEPPDRGDAADAPAGDTQPETGESAEPQETATASAGDTPGDDAASGEPETGGDGGRLGMNW